MGEVIYVLYYMGEVKLVATSHVKVAECEFNNVRDKLEIWIDGKLSHTTD